MGAMAHFRKVFSNSTSLSYYFPPRTTLMGVVAAAMGKDRDSYYEELNQFEYSLTPLTGLRKIMLGETYLDTDEVSVKSLRRLKQGVPTGREFVLPSNAPFLGYRVTVYPFHEVMEKSLRSPVYPLSLGTANMLAWVEDVKVEECEEIQEVDGEVMSVTQLKPEVTKDMRVAIEEMVPREFDAERHTGELPTYFVELNAKPLTVKGKGRGLRCGGENYLFL